MSLPPVSFVTVTRDGYFFVRLLVEKLRELVGQRDYEIIVVDRGSRDGTRSWLRRQPDVRLLTRRQWLSRSHGHGEAAEAGAAAARHERIVLLDSDAHPVDPGWLAGSADRLDDEVRLAGARFVDRHRGNPHGWYIHPHFMAFQKRDLGGLVVLRKLQGDDTDTGEEATIRVLAAGRAIVDHPITFCERFAVGHPRVPTVAGGVFHAWYVSRLATQEAEVIRETAGAVSRARYLDPLVARLREGYGLSY
jgi:glycosyltransferase involved in cell wall biosynthesis